MSTKAVANEDCKINFAHTVVPPDAIYGGDIPYNRTGITYTLSTKVKCKSKSTLANSISFAWLTTTPCPFTSATYNFVSGAGSITATSTKVKCESNAPMRLDDSGNCTGSWTLKVFPFTSLACSCTCSISDAGQDRVLSN